MMSLGLPQATPGKVPSPLFANPNGIVELPSRAEDSAIPLGLRAGVVMVPGVACGNPRLNPRNPVGIG